jgi:uncharacterized protein (TIGR03435 family)
MLIRRTRNEGVLPMRTRQTTAVVAAVVIAAAQALAQTPTPVKPMAADAHPSFAVAAIKPHDPASSRQGFSTDGDRFTIRNESVASLMMFAYSINKHQVIDLPAWAETTSYDIEGKTDAPGEPNLRQQQEMVQKLLAERFQLKFHYDKRELPVYAIRVTKGGPKLKPAANPDTEPDQQGNGHGTEQTVIFTSNSIADFVRNEQFFVDRPLLDQTSLGGRYDFALRYTYDEAKTTDPNAPPGLFTAVQEQLGLKFEPTKAPVEVLVIDHIELPSAN